MSMHSCVIQSIYNARFCIFFRRAQDLEMDLTALHKLAAFDATLRTIDGATRLAVIVKVTEAGYRPSSAVVRTEISSLLFTADILAAKLPQLDADPKVAARSIGCHAPRIAGLDSE